MEAFRWFGLVASLTNAVLSGIFLSFNVYAVQLKRTFLLNQTQVELLSSCTIIGTVSAVVVDRVYKRVGSKLTFAIAWGLTTSAALLTWCTTVYMEFFRRWLAFLYLFQLMLAVGTTFGHQSGMTIALENCPGRHIGKLTGLFLALTGLGKLYYATVMTLLNNDISHFFLVLPVPITVTLAICFFFHFRKTNVDQERERLTQSNGDKSGVSTNGGLDKERESGDCLKNTTADRKMLLQSGHFHMTVWSGVLFHACSMSVMNNFTQIAESVKLKYPLTTVDIWSVGVTFNRLAFGFIFDKFSSRKTGSILLSICYVTFGVAMIIGLLWLNDATIYVMTVLASVGAGAVCSLTVTILFSEFGKEHYSFVLGMYLSAFGALTACCQVIVGRAYDKAVLNTSSQQSPFALLYIISLCVDSLVLAVLVVKSLGQFIGRLRYD